MGLNLALFFTFVQLTKFHELLTMTLHVNIFLLYIIGVPSYMLLIAAGGLQRTWRSPQSRYWVGMALWMGVSVPFSAWIMMSLATFRGYIQTEIVGLFMVAGFVVTWREVERLMTVLALSAVVNIVAGRLFQQDVGDRFALSSGTLSDPNDFAAVLILLLPFLLLIVITPGRNVIVKVLSAGFIVAGLYLVLSTGSRGGSVALMAGLAYALWRVNVMQKMVAITVLAVLGVGLFAVLPYSTRERLATTFSDSAATDVMTRKTAIGSKEARAYLLRRSIEAALTHPIVGVGLEQFQNYEGVTARALGQRGNWHETHNTYTQIASEAGIPGFIFLFGGIISTVRLVRRTYRKARQMPATPMNQKIRRTCFAVMLSLLSFCTAAFFLSMAYRCYLPAMTGVAIAVARAAEREWQLNPQAATANPV